VLLLVSCAFKEQKDYAENCVLKHLHAREAGNLDEAIQYYGAPFFKEMPRPQWRQMLEKIQQKLGAPTAFELQNWNTTERALNGASGAYVVLTYQMTYEHATGTETFSLYRARGSDDVTIIGHNISSLALLK
jgi:hypothetical protein